MANYKSIYTGAEIDSAIGKANTALQEHQELKTINNESLVGEGNITIEGTSYEAGNNIQISEENVISATDTIYDDTELRETIAGKQEELISGINIKTINGNSILGEGNLVIEGGQGGLSSVAHDNTMTGAGTNESPLGINTETVASKSDIPDISTKQDVLISGTNIKTINNQSLLGEGNIVIGGSGETIILSDETWTLATSISNSGVTETNKPTFASTDYIEVNTNDVIKYTGSYKDSNDIDVRCCIAIYNANKTIIGTRQDLVNTGVTTDHTITANGYVRLMFGRVSATGITLTQDDIDNYCEVTLTRGSGGGSAITVVQNTGTSTTAVMSQNAVTNAINSHSGGAIKKITPCCDFISVPNEVVGADHWQSLVKIGNEIWLTQQSSAAGGTVNGIIDRISASDFSYIGKFNHNLGHLNCCEYDDQTDMLITGWASDSTGDPKKLCVFKNVLAWTELPTGSELNYSNVNVTEIDMSSYLSTLTGRSTVLGNAIWAERTSEGHRYAIVSVGNPTETFIKIMLGYGTNQRTYGTYTAAATDTPNGTFDVIWVKTITMPNIPGCTGVKTMINQDAKYYKGGILMALSAIPVTALYLYEQHDSNTLGFDIIRSAWANDNGVTQTGWNQGVLVMGDDIYIGIAPTTTGSTNPNKLAKFKI